MPSALISRPFTTDDLQAVLALAGTFWRRERFTLHAGDIVHHMSNIYRGRDTGRHFWLHERGGELIGLTELARTTAPGFELVLLPDARDPALERELLEWSADAMRAWCAEVGTPAARVATSAASTDARRIALLEALGYTRREPWLACSVRDLSADIPPPALPPGFTLRSVLGEAEADAVGAAHAGAFNSHWPPGEYLRVMRTPGFHIDRERVVAAPDGRVAAFCVYWLDPISATGLLEPVGCHAEFQGRGLTKALLFDTLRLMRDAGMREAVVCSELENPAAQRLYAAVGFTYAHTLLDYERTFP